MSSESDSDSSTDSSPFSSDSDFSSEDDSESSSSDGSFDPDSLSDSDSFDVRTPSKRQCKLQPYRCSVNEHFKVYALDISEAKFDYQKLLKSLKEEALALLQEIDSHSFKFSLAVCCIFKRELEDCEECSQENWFRSQCALKINDEDSETLIDLAVKEIELQIETLTKRGSGKTHYP